MTTSHISQFDSARPHGNGSPSSRAQRTTLVILYAALVAQLAAWSILAAHVGLTAAFSGASHGSEGGVVIGGAIWLFFFTATVATVTAKYIRNNR